MTISAVTFFADVFLIEDVAGDAACLRDSNAASAAGHDFDGELTGHGWFGLTSWGTPRPHRGAALSSGVGTIPMTTMPTSATISASFAVGAAAIEPPSTGSPVNIRPVIRR